MNVLLVNIPLVWYYTPPTGIFYLKGFLEKNGINCDVLDLNLEYMKKFCINHVPPSLPDYTEDDKFDRLVNKNNLIEYFDGYTNNLDEYDVVGFSVHSIQSLKIFNLIYSIFIEKIKSNTKVVVGGTASYDMNMMTDYSDFEVFNGIGEKFFSEFFGLGEYTELYNYNQLYNDDIWDTKHLSIFISRGCVNKCNYCYPREYFNIEHRKNSYIINEIVYMINKYDKYYFNFITENINNNPRYINDLSNMLYVLKKSNKKYSSLKWKSNFAIQDWSPDYSLLSKSGCYKLNVGIETGCDETRFSMNKFSTNEQIIKHLEECRKYNIENKFYIMTGYITETTEQFNKSNDFYEYLFSEYSDVIKEVKINMYSHSKGYCKLKNKYNDIVYDINGDWVYGDNTYDIRLNRLNIIYNLAKKYNLNIRSYIYED